MDPPIFSAPVRLCPSIIESVRLLKTTRKGDFALPTHTTVEVVYTTMILRTIFAINDHLILNFYFPISFSTTNEFEKQVRDGLMDQRSNGPTDLRTDKLSDRDAWTRAGARN